GETHQAHPRLGPPPHQGTPPPPPPRQPRHVLRRVRPHLQAVHARRPHGPHLRLPSTRQGQPMSTATVETLEPGSAPWLRTITASKLAAILGHSPWASPLS